ncbi:hypothetical protein [Vibrio agarivorans]|uniref:hypothetical protein n=1 Tax=Vibrio agarivorans TaxID=153622 RepID=UPI0025B4BF38|nr:hypothetical protein [Vibrio agarivorans]MDN3661174.1 hypothetical protein [Vibrio agarivorans]
MDFKWCVTLLKLDEYIKVHYDDSVPRFAKALNVSESAIYRMLKNKSESIFVTFIDGLPKLVTVKYALEPLPAYPRFQFYHSNLFMFTYAEQEYYVDKRFDSNDRMLLTCIKLGDGVGILDIFMNEFVELRGIGVMRFRKKHSSTLLFDVYFNSANDYYISSAAEELYFLDEYGNKVVTSLDEKSLADSIVHCLTNHLSFYSNEHLIFKG